MQLTLVVPCYNEAERLDLEAFRTFDAGSDQVGFLFVDDGSRDGTRRLLQSNGFDVLGLDRNVGKAEAVRRGIVAAMERGAEIVGFWDADLATPLWELPLFLDILKARPAIEMVYGARVRLLGRDISRHESRHYFGRIGATLISKTLGLAVYDTQCGAKLFRVSDTMHDVFAKPFLSRWIFDVEIIARFVRLRGRDGAARAIYELPLRVWKDVTGSKLRSTDFARALRDLWRIRRAYKR
ncbi:MAG TPA: glycosyltransferase [Thermoanaerobaculia bacterium]|nr:glycosyltransferase [Thermoanaerobaculia bacterium]